MSGVRTAGLLFFFFPFFGQVGKSVICTRHLFQGGGVFELCCFFVMEVFQRGVLFKAVTLV